MMRDQFQGDGRYLYIPGLFAILAFIIAFFVGYCILFHLGIFTIWPEGDTILRWDANWYNIIRNSGYYFDPEHTSPAAFFPMFPFIWYVSGLDAIGVSVMNALLFFTAFYFICRHLQTDFKQSLLYISVPASFFFMIPYSEAIFFVAVSLFLIGLDTGRNALVVIGLIIALFTRSISMIFAGAIVFTYIEIFFSNSPWEKARRIVLYLLLITVVTFIVFYALYLYTNEPVAFFRAQKMWHRELRFPTLPFTTISGIRMLWMDGLALLVCLLATVSCIQVLYVRIIEKRIPDAGYAALFSMASLSIIGIVSTFYSGVWHNGEGTSLISINRFVFASPFFIFFLHYMFTSLFFRQYGFVVIPVTTVSVWLMLGAYHPLKGHPAYFNTIVYFINLSACVSLYTLLQKFNFLYYLVIIIQIFVGLYLFHQYLGFHWVG